MLKTDHEIVYTVVAKSGVARVVIYYW